LAADDEGKLSFTCYRHFCFRSANGVMSVRYIEGRHIVLTFNFRNTSIVVAVARYSPESIAFTAFRYVWLTGALFPSFSKSSSPSFMFLTKETTFPLLTK